MGWIDINKILNGFKSRPKIKDKLKAQIIKAHLQKKGEIESVSFKNGKLEIKVKSPVFLQELFLNKENIKREINEYFKKETVKEIILKRG